MPGDVDLSERDLIMVLVVEDVEEVGVEGMDLVQLGELVDDQRQPIVEVLLGEPNLHKTKGGIQLSEPLSPSLASPHTAGASWPSAQCVASEGSTIF